MFAVSLELTLLIELPVVFLLGLRGWRHMLLAVLVNVLTNPAAVFLCWMGVPQLPVEIGVVVAEAAVYYRFSREESWRIPRPVLLSAAANGISWISGILIQTGGLL